MTTAAAPTSPQLRGGGITTVPSQHRAQDRHPVAVTPPSSQQRGPTHPNVMKGSHTVNTSTSRGAATGHTLTAFASRDRTPSVTTYSTEPPCADTGPQNARSAMPDRDAVLAQLRRERARREMALNAIGAQLQEQPSAHSVYACARRWCTAINFLADDVIAAQTGTENE